MSAGIKANVDGSAAIQVGGTDVITLTSGGAATFVTSPTTVQAGTAAAPSITFSGDTNTGIYSPGADQVAIATGGTAAVTVSSSQNVGIGGTPAQRLDVFGVTSDATPVALLRAYTTGSDGARTVPVRFVSSNNNNWANAQYEAYNHNFNGNGTLIMTVKQEGAVVLKGGDTAANGTGITFPATQSASSNANTLDDYEEGTWSPSVGGNATYSVQQGQYIKIGRLVYVQGKITIATLGTGSTSVITNLPFVADVSGGSINGSGTTTYFSSLAVSAGALVPFVVANTTQMAFNTNASTGTTQTGYNAAVFGNNTRIDFCLTYYANA